MSDMFESLDLNMREEAERVNPTKAIMASQLECEKRFEGFVARNPERVDFLSDDIRSVADKYAAEYDIPSETIYEATVTHLKEAAVRKNSYEDLFDDGHSRVINDFVGSNMDLDQIEMYFNQYKPEIESMLRSPYDEERHQQLVGEVEHLKEELQGISDEEEGSERYWNLEEQIVDALSSLNDHQQRQTFSSVEKEAEWDKPWTEEDESKEESEEHEESESEEEEDEEKKKSSVKQAGFEDETSIVKELLMGGKDYESDDPNHSLGMSMMTGGQFGGHPYNVVLGMIANHMFKDINDFIHWMDENVVGNYNKRVLESGESQQVIDESKVDWQSIWSMLVHDVQEYWSNAKERYNASKEENEGDSIYGGGEPEWYDKYHDWKVSSVKTANIKWEDLGDGFYRGNGPHGEWNIDKQTREDQIGMGLEDYDGMTDYRKTRYQLAHIPHGYYEGTGNLSHDVRDVYDTEKEAIDAAHNYQSQWNDRDQKQSSIKTAEVNLVPPDGVRSAAKRGIKYHSEGKAGDGFESATLARAKRIAAGEELTPEHVKRMHSFFERHAGGRSQKAKQGEITPWDVAWLAWGGDSGRSWAARKVEELERAEKTSAKKCECWDGYKRVPGTKPCAPGSCEKCDAHRKKEAAIEEFINLHEAALIPDWMRPEKGMTWRDLLQRSNRQKLDGADSEEVSDATNPEGAGTPQEVPSDQQPTVEFSPAKSKTPYEEMLEDQSRAEEKMKENARKREEMIEGEPQFKTRGPKRYEYLRGASVQDDLKEFYVSRGMPEKTASMIVEAVGEMAQLQQDAPGFPLDASDPENVKIDKAIGGKEGDKYQNWDVKDKQKELGLEHQDFTDFGEPVREFIQPGGEAPYSENTKKRIDDAEQDNLNAKGVKQEDNAPKKSNASVKEATLDFDQIDSKVEELMKQGMTPEQAIQSLDVYNEDIPKGWGGSKTSAI